MFVRCVEFSTIISFFSTWAEISQAVGIKMKAFPTLLCFAWHNNVRKQSWSVARNKKYAADHFGWRDQISWTYLKVSKGIWWRSSAQSVIASPGTNAGNDNKEISLSRKSRSLSSILIAVTCSGTTVIPYSTTAMHIFCPIIADLSSQKVLELTIILIAIAKWQNPAESECRLHQQDTCIKPCTPSTGAFDAWSFESPVNN